MAVISVCGDGRGRRLTGTVIRARPQLCLECFHSSEELSKTPPPPEQRNYFCLCEASWKPTKTVIFNPAELVKDFKGTMSPPL